MADSVRTMNIGGIEIGGGEPVLIAGPCVVENREMVVETARRLKSLCAEFSLGFIFKASYRKANRTSLDGFAGIGDAEALAILSDVRETLSVPVLTDVHSVQEVEAAARAVDVLQIPAFLCRQTDLLVAAGGTGKAVNIKKGQFVAPGDMGRAVEKVVSTGNERVLLTERGASFGYHNLVVDMRSLVIMRGFGYPVVFDATHSVQLPGGGRQSGGAPEFILPLARAAAAVGVDGFFAETHPDPAAALSDAATQVPLDRMKDFIRQVLAIDASRRSLMP